MNNGLERVTRKYPQQPRIRRTAIFVRMLPMGGLGYLIMLIVLVTVLWSAFEKTMEWQREATVIAYRFANDMAALEPAAGQLLKDAQLD